MASAKSINPATGEVINEYELFTNSDITNILEESARAYKSWRTTSFKERADLIKKAGKLLVEQKSDLGKLISLEMGKVYKESVAEVEKCAALCDYYAENGEKFLSDEIIKTEATQSFISFQPIGTVLAVMPWNFPLWQVFRFAVPTLMAGNAGVLKHASNVCGCALAIEKIFQEAGFPENIFRTLLISSSTVKQVIEHNSIKAVTLTGSNAAGQSVAGIAGNCLKKTVLELGGSDAYIILKDADVSLAASLCVKSRMLNAGQSCIAAKRFIVEETVYNEFLNAFTENMQNIKYGDPFAADTNIGPIASTKLRESLHNQVERAIASGAKCTMGGAIPNGNGAFYPPTILTGITTNSPAFAEELFGPVAAIIKAKNQQDAIVLANQSEFGLGGAVFSKDIKSATHIAKYEIQSGSCFVNDFVRSDQRLPFGGIKQSGYGRELGMFGIREFVNIKTIYVK